MVANSVQGPQVTLGYDLASRLTKMTRMVDPAGPTITSTFSFDAADRLTHIVDVSSGNANLDLNYAYDAASRVTSYTGPEGTLSYGYDNKDELTSVTGARNESYSYCPDPGEL